MNRRVHWMRTATLAVLLLGALGAGAHVAEPRFALPVDCRIGVDCWPVNLFDHDAGSGWRDFACGAMSYDGHDGTDFWLRDQASMDAGVSVLAAAPGQVRGVRDGMPDIAVRRGGREAIAGRECGNGLVLDHGDGWETQYCHMRKGSLAVRQDQRVETGTVLGKVGLSGLTELPHLHFSVRHDGKLLDPFVGLGAPPRCPASAGVPASPAGNLWQPALRAPLKYAGGTIVNYGFAAHEVSFDDIEAGKLHAATLPTQGPLLVLWVVAVGVAPGDRVALRLAGPDGATLAETDLPIDRAQIRIMRLIGKRVPQGGFAAGIYRAELAVTRARDGAVDAKTAMVTLRDGG
jgi:hypothetical protein